MLIDDSSSDSLLELFPRNQTSEIDKKVTYFNPKNISYQDFLQLKTIWHKTQQELEKLEMIKLLKLR
jgi:hypothetical protein